MINQRILNKFFIITNISFNLYFRNKFLFHSGKHFSVLNKLKTLAKDDFAKDLVVYKGGESRHFTLKQLEVKYDIFKNLEDIFQCFLLKLQF